ncbi:hypothetical protein HaLaN_17682 [Haematococcus lacustris]|uniref:Uncharacterized protein n=1 Tax=Haematococcus lacustris TaxID=44745 RepID=A0A699ZX62_HAELA|nr:hypothetical protein HaLaN_17682 [Haematococcus lacustris]
MMPSAVSIGSVAAPEFVEHHFVELYTKKVKGVVIITLLGGLTHLDYDCNIMVGAAMEFKNGVP